MISIDVTASIDGKTIKSSQIYKLSSLKYIFGRKHGTLKDDLIKRLRKEYNTAKHIEILEYNIDSDAQSEPLTKAI